MRRARVDPLTATVGAGSALLRSIAGEPADRIAPVMRLEAPAMVTTAAQAAGRGAARRHFRPATEAAAGADLPPDDAVSAFLCRARRIPRLRCGGLSRA
jgi:hypothetical protein